MVVQIRMQNTFDDDIPILYVFPTLIKLCWLYIEFLEAAHIFTASDISCVSNGYKWVQTEHDQIQILQLKRSFWMFNGHKNVETTPLTVWTSWSLPQKRKNKQEAGNQRDRIVPKIFAFILLTWVRYLTQYMHDNLQN